MGHIMEHALFQVNCTEMCVGCACPQPSYNDTLLSSVFVLIPLYVLSQKVRVFL